MPQARPLPPELIDHIIGYLHAARLPDLCSCALVCKAWVSPSRSRLFHSISIHPYKRPFSRYLQLFEVLKQFPSLGLLVRKLCVGYMDAPSSSNRLEWLEIRGALPQVSGSLTRLRTLELNYINWEWLTPDLKTSFLDILSLPSLIDFGMRSVVFPTPKHLASVLYPHLKRLDLESTRWGDGVTEGEDEQRVMAVAARQPCRLEYLGLSTDVRDIDVFNCLLHQSPIDLSNLHTLDATLYLDGGQHDRVLTFCRSLPTSLEHLAINYYVEEPNPSNIGIDLGCLPNLLTLSLRTGEYPDPASFLIYTLSKLTSIRLQKFYFEFTLSTSTIWGDWVRLDSILDGSAFSSLHNVSPFVISDPSMDPDVTVQKFMDGFPKLRSRDMLDTKFFFW